MDFIKSIKKLVWRTINRLPFRLRYIVNFRSNKGRWPRLRHPQDYCDFIFIDCYYGRHNQHAYLADKLEVRKYVEQKGLSHILTKLYGSWDNSDKIDFEKLPDQFALKCNHSCAMNIICYDKQSLDIAQTRKKLNVWLKTKHPIFHEQHYKHIKPMIICEEIIPNDEDGFFPMDYKIHCAHGNPIFIQCCMERSEEEGSKMVCYDTTWNKVDYIAHTCHYTDKDVICPKHLNLMLEYASVLSKGLDYARIDLYDTSKGVIFGEITLTPQGGWLNNFTQEALLLMGNAIKEGKRNARKHK